jgi:ADP-ribose pyrophosphatase YjhB (NUDIX family)
LQLAIRIMNTLSSRITALETELHPGTGGLPEEAFLFIGRHSPILCVELIIRDSALGTLLTWRDDDHFGRGWHVPGGAIRFRESRDERIQAVARSEVGTEVDVDPSPLAIQEYLNFAVRERSHQWSFLMRCSLRGEPDRSMRCEDPGAPKPGEWMWHKDVPSDLLPIHHSYAQFIGGETQGHCIPVGVTIR